MLVGTILLVLGCGGAPTSSPSDLLQTTDRRSKGSGRSNLASSLPAVFVLTKSTRAQAAQRRTQYLD